MYPRIIYYDKATGMVLHDTREIDISGVDNFEAERVENDYKVINSLRERDRESIGEIHLELGQYRQDFNEGILGRINPDTLELEFSYPDPNAPEPEVPVIQAPLSEQVADLKRQNTELMIAVAELAGTNEMDKLETQLAIAELATMIGGVS